MKNSHLPWAKKEQTSNAIDLQKLFNAYWTSKAHEITIKGQSWSSTNRHLLSKNTEVVDIGKGHCSLELRFSVNATVRLFAAVHRRQLIVMFE